MKNVALNLPGTEATPIRNQVLRMLTIESATEQNVLSHLVNPLAGQVSIGGTPFTF
jgi:hypothetical protein